MFKGRSATFSVQGLVFSGLDGCTISCNVSFKKDLFFEPSREVPLWAALVSSLFLLFFLFSVVLKKNVLLFSCISFKYVLLLARSLFIFFFLL